ncbi:MAG: glycosyltransferase family 2 protein [Lachnospiraceae bacterium]|nr:glycosyltransferase family 2 protein [Lachnospiraceae bacterium]
MKLQVLVAAMNAKPKELAEKMNLRTDALIVNQCDAYAYEEFEREGRLIKCLSMAERGVGLSRNTALMRSDADVILFSDEDICLEDDYEAKILSAFEKNKDADLILFNMEIDPARATYHNDTVRRVRWYNYGRYGTVAAAVRREVLLRAGITFSLLFGGGAKYSNGEDSLFLHDCLKHGMHLYTETACIGKETYRESTWFHGYTEKFFFDRGVLYAYLYGPMAAVWAYRYLFVKRKVLCKDIPLGKAFRLMKDGIREGKNIRGKRS